MPSKRFTPSGSRDPTGNDLAGRDAVRVTRRVVEATEKDQDLGYWGRRAAGFLLTTGTHVFVLQRSPRVREGLTWAIPGGKVDPGENALVAAKREVEEEVGSLPEGLEIVSHWVFRDDLSDFRFTTFVAKVPEDTPRTWRPRINWESNDWNWVSRDDLDHLELHPGFATFLKYNDPYSLPPALTERYGGSEQSRGIWYHGTTSKVLPQVLSQGLIPYPKVRAWASDKDVSVGSPSRVSYGGIYLTKNLLTATSSSSNAGNSGRGNTLVVAVDIQERSIIADEDNVASPFFRITNGRGLTPNAERILEWLYFSNLKGINKSEVDGFKKEWIDNIVMPYLDMYLTPRSGEYDSSKMTPEVAKRITSVASEAFHHAVARQVGYIFTKGDQSKDYYWKRAASSNGFDYDDPPPIPDWEEEERIVRGYVDKLTYTLKDIARIPTFSQVGRSMKTIGFSGSNRIVAVVEVVGKYPTRKLVLHYGTLPDDFVQQWEERIGELPPVVTPQQHNEATSFKLDFPGERLFEIDVASFDKGWKKNKAQYLSAGEHAPTNSGIDRYKGFRAWVTNHPEEQVKAPSVNVRPNGLVDFGDGRHRYAVLRDSGSRVVVSMTYEAAKNAMVAGYDPRPVES